MAVASPAARKYPKKRLTVRSQRCAGHHWPGKPPLPKRAGMSIPHAVRILSQSGWPEDFAPRCVGRAAA